MSSDNGSSGHIGINSRITIALICLIGGVTLTMLCWCIYTRNRRNLEDEENELHQVRRGRGARNRGMEMEMEKNKPALFDVWIGKPSTVSVEKDEKNSILLPLSAEWTPSPSQLTISTIIALPSQTPLSKEDSGVGFPNISIGVLELGVIPEPEDKKRTFFKK
ncbi:hypothetical protein Moror_734 [Moniliophthora roreri MCA 2997]|uniref:Transmembrane protein n=2 Tax=Moniliophthora roreri TaxID=221103 RepID=V2YE48_MONRO|nr:hypothetical protein Moror_734 [Moniliophthora roreri MCA 2997]KAI3614421.1 hypothetical protein WG66_009660 [Moniliophthora roreri]